GEISAASHEQTQGIEQINQAITQMDQVTQQNAALVEEAAAAAASLQDQAGSLSQVVSVFTLQGGNEAAPRVLRRVAPTAAASAPAARRVNASKAPKSALPSRNKDAQPQLAMASTQGDWTEF
ncbi:methyl-accepting chemotaxis protein, partial [Variovorax sp. J2R1-6]|nr:methyl-accepting chemotaxis protein [Variovorax sp. J2R1-6]